MTEHTYIKHLQINHKKKFFFIHIPKCGGTSIDESELFLANKYPAKGHAGYYKFRAALAQDFKSYKCFTLVRNPWDRLSSAFYYLSEGGAGNPVDLRLKKEYLDVFENDFKAFIDDFIQRPEIYLKLLHMKPMHEFFNPSRCGIDYFIQKLESIEALDELKSFLNEDFLLPHKRKRKNYTIRDNYNNKTFDAVKEIYLKDVTLFSYDNYELKDINN